MSQPQLDKIYDPKQVEERWSRRWIELRLFHASVSDRRPSYCIVIPPPNVTGSLHVGHALNNTLQDILIRRRRMQGYNTLWMPGMDHAGIATQNVVERQLQAEGTSREVLGREEFLNRVQQWKEHSGGVIIAQLKRLGASCDWERQRFTMDPGLSEAVKLVFVRLYEDGLLYRGERLINWCPRCLTALSDIEVEHEDSTGKLYTIRYPLADDPSQYLLVATTRPETMLGDTAVAVHPEDDRYRHLIGSRVQVLLTRRTVPIVADPILVDREFGTGAVKVTPAHDFNDFEAGERHGLPRIKIMDIHANLQLTDALAEPEVIEAVNGLPAAKARPKIEQLLAERGFLEKAEPHKMALGKCYRCKTVVEPFLSDQWFVNIKPLAQPAVHAVEDGRVRILPESWKNNYLGWMRDIKDWCVSRQIWWGHQIPAWYCEGCYGSDFLRRASDGQPLVPSDAVPIVAQTKPAACSTCSSNRLVQDPDVLDTWFSSALWPFSTLGWPQQTPELKVFYPTSTLVTGLDILFFWVARMIMMGLKFMGDVPFRDVYIHALVRDAEGQKMSKSKGNVIDPLQVMDQYGTDALRFTLAAMASPGRDVKLAEERIEGYRNFANKIWNAARFILMHLDGKREARPAHDRSVADRWILSRLNATIRAVNQEVDQYRFDRAAGILYHFIWHEYCDWYLELAKLPLQDPSTADAARARQTLLETFEHLMRLLHPFMPFVTEEIWQTLPHEGNSIVIQSYPAEQPEWHSEDAEDAYSLLQRAVSLMRTGRSLLDYAPGKSIGLHVMGAQEQDRSRLDSLAPAIGHLARGPVSVTPTITTPSADSGLLSLAAEGITVGVAVEGDVDLVKALDRIKKQKDEAGKEMNRLSAKLANAGFVEKAPQEVIDEHRARLQLLTRDHGILDRSEQQLQDILRSRTA
ncbi:MAG TPA: valine--tRNA ligase [Nitrospiraceae bacterium]|nr:valine--tRNA ligase [Nitrospiraceae bacterium]